MASEVPGDGIAHLLADSAGDVRVGYTDEGVYGNYGWGRHGIAEPAGSCALVRWPPSLRDAWRYPSASPSGSNDDCYVLNVDGTTTWTCYDAGFPIVRILDGELAGWRNPIRRAAAIAVDGHRAALFGAFGRLTIGELSPGQFQPAGEYRVVQSDGSPLPATTQVIGRGAALHFLTDDYWYRLGIRDVSVQPHAS